MSAEIFPGDEWQHAPEPKRSGPTRAKEQARINAPYATGRMTAAEHRGRSAELSEPTKWSKDGRLK